MFSVERRGAPAFKRKHNSTQNLDFKNRRKPLGRPISTSTWLPDDSASAHHAHGVPIYLSFVSKAILWDRGLSHHTIHDRPNHHPLLCPRFLSHMKTGPEDIRPPCFLSSKSRPQPAFQGKMLNTHTPAAPKRQTLEGFLHPSPDRRKLVKNDGSIPGRRSAFVIPCLQLPSSSSTIYPTFPHLNTLHADSGGQQRKKNTMPSSPPDPPPAPEEKVWEKEPHLAVVSITESVSKLHLRPSGPERFPSPVSVVSHGSLSDFSRPPSSLFSRSTNLSSRISVLSVSSRDSDPDGCYSRRSSINTPNSPTLYEAASGQIKPLSPRPMSGVPPQADKSLSRPESSKASENLPQGATADLHFNPSMDSHHGLITRTTPSATFYLNPQWTTPRSGSRPKLTPSASVTRQESHRWPVLPPIAPVRGCCSTPASRYSELSCSDSRVFDELEAIAPRSTSSPSVDKLSDSSGSPSPPKELSPGLAALTVGCDSGNLGSLSRVQLLLLDRLEPETLMSPFDQEDLDWSDLWKDYDHTGVSRPLTAGSISERCDSTGKVQKNKSNRSEGGSGSPSSWIMGQSPSYNMFRSATSPCNANHGSSTNEGGPTSEGASAGGRRSGNFDHSAEEKDRRMDERKSKALDMLTKLQEDKPHQANGSRGRSNFDDFAFLAKYCIFSPVKLSEYKRVFEAEDSDDDGYISCLQVLLALKTIIPSGLLSDEEETYVYKILEMVDFRVTDGLVDLRLFAVISSLAQKIATMDEFMRSLISNMDFRSLEVRLFKVKQLFLFLLEEQQGDTGTQRGFISAEQLLLELKAGGIHLEQEAAVRLELQRMPPLDLLDFLAHLPLFMLIHKSVIANPLDDSSNL